MEGKWPHPIPTIFLWLVGGYAGFCVIGLAFLLWTTRDTEHNTQKFFLPTGEVITNESLLANGFRKSHYNNHLYFQQHASAPRESLGNIWGTGIGVISLSNSNPRLLRNGDRTVLIIEKHVFKQWHWSDRKEPYWYHVSTNPRPDTPAQRFLRSCLESSDQRIRWHTDHRIRDVYDIRGLDDSYVFDHIDFDNDVLVTRREKPDTSLPTFLIYSAKGYKYTWEFDLERTRIANNLKPPSDSDLVIDFSAVTYPGHMLSPKSRDVVMMLPGAKETHENSLPLSSSAWTTTTSLTEDGGQEHFSATLGFIDPVPEFLLVYFKPAAGINWRFVKTGDWINVSASGLQGDICRSVFFRVRHTSSMTNSVQAPEKQPNTNLMFQGLSPKSNHVNESTGPLLQSQAATLDDFIGVRWGTSIEEAKKIVLSNSQLMLEKQDNDIVGSLSIRGGSCMGKPVAWWYLAFVNNKFCHGFVDFRLDLDQRPLYQLRQVRQVLVAKYGNPFTEQYSHSHSDPSWTECQANKPYFKCDWKFTTSGPNPETTTVRLFLHGNTMENARMRLVYGQTALSAERAKIEFDRKAGALAPPPPAQF